MGNLKSPGSYEMTWELHEIKNRKNLKADLIEVLHKFFEKGIMNKRTSKMILLEHNLFYRLQLCP